MFKRVHFHPRLIFPTTMTSADSCHALTRQASPGKNAVFPRTITPFTCRAKPNGFAVLCQLTKPGRPCIGFLSTDLRVSPMLAEDLGREPSDEELAAELGLPRQKIAMLKPMLLEDVGREFGVFRERIRQLQNSALAKMRNALLKKDKPTLKPFERGIAEA